MFFFFVIVPKRKSSKEFTVLKMKYVPCKRGSDHTNYKDLQVNNYEIVIKFFDLSHNLTWYSTIVHKNTRFYQVCSTYELTKQFM